MLGGAGSRVTSIAWVFPISGSEIHRNFRSWVGSGAEITSAFPVCQERRPLCPRLADPMLQPVPGVQLRRTQSQLSLFIVLRACRMPFSAAALEGSAYSSRQAQHLPDVTALFCPT